MHGREFVVRHYEAQHIARVAIVFDTQYAIAGEIVYFFVHSLAEEKASSLPQTATAVCRVSDIGR